MPPGAAVSGPPDSDVPLPDVALASGAAGVPLTVTGAVGVTLPVDVPPTGVPFAVAALTTGVPLPEVEESLTAAAVTTGVAIVAATEGMRWYHVCA